MTSPQRHLVNREVVADNEAAARAAHQRGDYVTCILLIHALTEALLRAFLEKTGDERFSELVERYEAFLIEQGQPQGTFVTELNEFNRRRNRIVHGLWGKGYTHTNRNLDAVCRAAFLVYGLFIEWLETFDPQITAYGFECE